MYAIYMQSPSSTRENHSLLLLRHCRWRYRRHTLWCGVLYDPHDLLQIAEEQERLQRETERRKGMVPIQVHRQQEQQLRDIQVQSTVRYHNNYAKLKGYKMTL